MIKRTTLLLGLLSCLPIFGMTSTLVGPNLKTDNKQAAKQIYYAELFDVPKYDSSDLGKENSPEELKKFYDYNFANLGIKDPNSDALVWDNDRGEGITVGVIDSGIDIFHEEFLTPDSKGVQLDFDNIEQYSLLDPRSGCFYCDPETFEVKKDIGLRYAYQEGELTQGFYSHGTAVSATIGAAVNSAGGWGVAPNVNILFISIDMSYQAIGEAIKYVSDCGAKVINMSLGGYAETWTDEKNRTHYGAESVKDELTDAINYAHQKDVVVVASAGNDDTSKLSYPAANDGVIGIGALEEKSGSIKSSYSNYNRVDANESSLNNVDVTTNGSIYAAQVDAPDPNNPDAFVMPSLPRTSDHHYDVNVGTSFSGPAATGTIALYRSKYPNKTYEEVADALYASCDDIGLPGWDYVHGHGRINAYNFLNSEIEVSNVAINEQDININLDDHIDYPGQKLSLSYAPSNASLAYKKGSWSSSNIDIVQVDKLTGDIKAIAPGSADITFTTKLGNKLATTKVNVTGQAKLVDNSIPLVVDEMIRVKLNDKGMVNATSGSPIFYNIQDEEIASVDIYGNITTKSLGSTIIRATSNNETKLIQLHVHPGNDLVSIYTPYAMSVFYQEDWRGNKFKVIATYEDGTTQEVNALISKYPNLKTIGFTPVEYKYSEYGITKTYESYAFVSVGENADYIYALSEGNNINLSPFNYFKGNDTYITDSNLSYWYIHADGSNVNNINYSYDDIDKASIIGEDNGVNPNSIHITCNEYALYMNDTSIYKIRLLINDSDALVSAKVGETDFSVTKTNDPLNPGYVLYEFIGDAEGIIDISITNISKRTAIKSLGCDFGYDRRDELAKAYIDDYLKLYSSCASSWNSRAQITYVVTEYNNMPQMCRDSKLFNETFIDNGDYSVTPLEKLKMMVSQYNQTLQEGEEQLFLILQVDEQGKPTDIYTGSNIVNKFAYNQTVLYIFLAGLGVISISAFILLLSKRRRTRR